MLNVDDVELIKGVTEAPIVYVLKALYLGLEVPLLGYNCRLVETYNRGAHIVSVHSNEVLYGHNWSTNELISAANELSKDQIREIKLSILRETKKLMYK